MPYLSIVSIFIVGLSGLVAQVLLLRELLISFYGNELTIGVILANWIVTEALGVFILGKLADKVKNKENLFVLLQVAFSMLLPIAAYFCRTFKILLGMPYGQGVGLDIIFTVSFLIVLPVGFCHGALFSTLSVLYARHIKDAASSIGKVYSWETIGTIAGGLLLTYFLIPKLNSFQAIFIISFINLALCFIFFKKITLHIRILIIALFVFLFGYFYSNKGPNYLEHVSIKRRWKNEEVLDYRNSVYGNITLIKRLSQLTFFYNGLPVVVTPNPNTLFTEEFGHLPLLCHPQPKDVLVVGAGCGGLLKEILKHPLDTVDYLEIDQVIIKLLRKYPTPLTSSELNDERVKIINVDGRYYLNNTSKKYDVILIGISDQSNLTTNRFFTKEFFQLTKGRLKREGIVAFWLNGSLVYLSEELKELHFCLLNSFKESYDYLRIIPGDYSIYMGSSSKDLVDADPDLIFDRVRKRGLEAKMLSLAYLRYRLDKYWVNWFLKDYEQFTSLSNDDLKPYAVFSTLALWNKEFPSKLLPNIALFKRLKLSLLLLILVFVTIFLIVLLRPIKRAKLAIVYSIASTGFFGMLTNLILVFAYQVYYGYLYHKIGIFIAIFMSGIAAGSIFITGRLSRIKNHLIFFLKLEVATIIYLIIMMPLLSRVLNSYQIFSPLFFVAGILLGMQFPVASKIYLKNDLRVGYTTGTLYAADLVGGWLAGILGAIVLIPVLGIINTCILMIMFKLSSLGLLLSAKKRLTRGLN